MSMEHFHLFVSSISFINVLNFSVSRSFISFAKLIPTYFILSDAIVNAIVFLISLSDSSLLVYSNATAFNILILYAATLLHLFIYLFLINLFLFIFGCVGSSLLCTGFLQLWQAGATLRCSARASHCSGFSCCKAWALGAWPSVVVAHRHSSYGSRALERRLSGCGTRAQLLCGMWDLPGPRIEPVSPALSGRLLTTVPPGKSLHLFFSSEFLVES